MISILFAIVIVGVIIYLVESMIPPDARPIRVVVRIVGVLVIVILLLRLLGITLP